MQVFLSNVYCRSIDIILAQYKDKINEYKVLTEIIHYKDNLYIIAIHVDYMIFMMLIHNVGKKWYNETAGRNKNRRISDWRCMLLKKLLDEQSRYTDVDKELPDLQ